MAQEDGNLELPPESANQEYELMLTIERLESVREEMDEVGFSTLNEVEAALKLTDGSSQGNGTSQLAEKRALLLEIRDELLDLGLATYAEVDDQIATLHRQLDHLEGFDSDASQ